MDPLHFHQLLQKQLRETIGEGSAIPESFQSLLQKISATYDTFDEDRKKIEQEVELRTNQLIGSTSRAYSFLDSLNMGFIMCDINAEVVLTNVSVRHILALKMADTNTPQLTENPDIQWTLDTIDALLQPEIQLATLIRQCLASNHPIECKEVTYGKRVLHLFIASMANEASKGDAQQIGAVILVEDITEQVVLERSKDEFLSIASHELRTPLTAIRGNASLIKTYYGDRLPDKNTVEMIDDIHESAIRLIEIVNDFLDASALEQGKIIMNPEIISLNEVINDVVRELQNLCDSKGISLVSDASVGRANSVTADKQRTKQVIYNLVGNAVKFTDKGSITISTREDDQFIYTVVSDTGSGMSVENQRLLFRKFQQAGSSLLTRDSTKGTGLGLYISKLIVERSGGKIQLENSELGKGSSFVFSLPRSKSAH